MIELYLSKVTESSETETAGKTYARVNYKQTLSVSDMARHMAEHNTVFSEGSILGVLTDFVKCVREQVLNGNTVPSSIARMVPFGLFHIWCRLYSLMRCTLGVMVAHFTATPYFLVALALSMVT